MILVNIYLRDKYLKIQHKQHYRLKQTLQLIKKCLPLIWNLVHKLVKNQTVTESKTLKHIAKKTQD